uniref:Grh/CP2 DB domain-containing protein n=1 Tax=Strigamia maritima TaxID=126957 RepID=T1JFF2_STRMM
MPLTPLWNEEMESEQKYWEPSQNASCMVSEDDSEGYWSVCSEHGAIASEEMANNGAIFYKTRCRQVTTSSPQTPTVNTNVVSSPHLLHNVPSYPVNNSILTQNRFQYVLGAATSIATKMHEETLTYLNQGQSYEIKLKKLGDLTEFRGKLLKSIVRVSFHERRLQYTEKEQIQNWRQTRPNERILEIDVPLSYGICDVVQDQIQLNACEFVWDPTKETGVFIRVNCVSTEFTPKKHGGEKGVPFRIQIETFTHSDGPPQRLHCASCQVKVFKFEFSQCALDTIYTSPAPPPPSTVSSTISHKNNESFQYSPSPDQLPPGTPTSMTADSPVGEHTNDSIDNPVIEFMQMYQQPLPSEATAAQASQWLHANRFGQYVRMLSGFSGADILRLNRDDLIQICGIADGIRLFNTRTIRPRLTIYVCLEPEQVYHAIYLGNLTLDELLGKLAIVLSITPQQIHDIFIQGPSGIHILVADEVIQNIPQESMFAIEIIKDQTSEFYHLLLKTNNSQ